MVAKIIIIMSPKGGVGKTTISVNIAAALATLNKRVLVVDANVETPHVAIHYGFVGFRYSLEDVLNGNVTVANAIYKTKQPNLHILPSRVFKGRGDGNARFRLINLFYHLEKISNNYDFIIIDSKPSSGLDFVKMIKNPNLIIVSMPEITSTIEAQKLVHESKESGINVLGLVLNRVNNKISGYMSETEVRKMFSINKIWMVPEEWKAFEALKKGVPIVLSQPKTAASRTFLEIAKDLIKIQ
jgi:MinD-like ATPase involved in chromosome partitioning or flagellar assembly